MSLSGHRTTRQQLSVFQNWMNRNVLSLKSRILPYTHLLVTLINLYILVCTSYLIIAKVSKTPPPEDPCKEEPMPCILQQAVVSPSVKARMAGGLSRTETGSNWKFSQQPSHLPLCSEIPPLLNGTVPVDLFPYNFSITEAKYSMLLPGGRWFPSDCISRHKVAIIIPYRDREAHLKILINHLHGFLQKQELDYAIIVVEQAGTQKLNKAKLMDVAYIETKKLYPWECFVFHDVDLVPEDDRNLYACPVQPRHMSVAIDKFDYALPYNNLFGGVVMLTPDQFESVNGYSTDYWGWGAEDDDMTSRVLLAGYEIARYPPQVTRYKMLKHRADKGNPRNACAKKFLSLTKKRWQKHGLRQLENYKVLKVEFRKLYTHIMVDLMKEKSIKKLHEEVSC